jgi:hypothetical protein
VPRAAADWLPPAVFSALRRRICKKRNMELHKQLIFRQAFDILTKESRSDGAIFLRFDEKPIRPE